MEFWEHGSFEITIQENILILDAEGPFNSELITRYYNELKTRAVAFNDEPWAHVAILRGLCSFTPDVFSLLPEVLDWKKSNLMVSEAVCFIDAGGASLTKQQIADSYGSAGIENRTFENLDDAITWSKQNLLNQ